MPSFLCVTNSGRTSKGLNGGRFECEILDECAGFASLKISGKCLDDFRYESGGHRFQRIPPTEKRGRVHTSTITVACYELKDKVFSFDKSDIEITTTRGSGPGGQHRNTTDSCVTAIHKPSGISVRIDGRSQHANRRMAIDLLNQKVIESEVESFKSKIDSDRKNKVGTGQRGDKIRTYRYQDNLIIDHKSGQKWRLDEWMKGR